MLGGREMSKQSMAIICTACNEDTFIRREPIYDGFEKTGEKISCISCGHVFDDETDVPFKDNSGPKIFTDADRSKKIKIFKSDEKGRNCRHCTHYIVNPFVQRCGLHNKDVKATDLCEKFSTQKPVDDKDDPLSKLLNKSPLSEDDIDFKRNSDYGRSIDL